MNFKDYIVVVVFRHDGVDFGGHGGLAVHADGEAKVVGWPVAYKATNAGWYSSTLAIFPRKGITSVEGQKLPKGKEP